MTVFVGVSRKTSFLRLSPGETNFWCVAGQSSRAQPGDQLLLYIPVAVSRSVSGIGQIYQITSSPRVVHRSLCASLGMAHIDTVLMLKLEERVTAKDMKADSIVRHWAAIRRNFQGTTFLVSGEIWQALRRIIVAHNPRSDAILERG